MTYISLELCLERYLSQVAILLASQISGQSLYHGLILALLPLKSLFLIIEHFLPIVVIYLRWPNSRQSIS